MLLPCRCPPALLDAHYLFLYCHNMAMFKDQVRGQGRRRNGDPQTINDLSQSCSAHYGPGFYGTYHERLKLAISKNLLLEGQEATSDDRGFIAGRSRGVGCQLLKSRTVQASMRAPLTSSCASEGVRSDVSIDFKEKVCFGHERFNGQSIELHECT